MILVLFSATGRPTFWLPLLKKGLSLNPFSRYDAYGQVTLPPRL
jgi:hypothetical protein